AAAAGGTDAADRGRRGSTVGEARRGRQRRRAAGRDDRDIDGGGRGGRRRGRDLRVGDDGERRRLVAEINGTGQREAAAGQRHRCAARTGGDAGADAGDDRLRHGTEGEVVGRDCRGGAAGRRHADIDRGGRRRGRGGDDG